MRLKFKTREDKLSELSQYLPDGDFIAVFGTSHTSGVCKRGDSEAISREDIWAEQVGAALGLPVFNASMPGNDNDTIVQQMIDFLDVPGARERCKRVICELRIAEGTTRMSRDLLGDFGVFRRAEFVPQLTNCYSVPAKTVVDPEDGGLVGHTTITDKLLVRLPTSFKRQDKKRQYQLLLDMLPDIIDTPAPSMYDVVMDVLDNFINYENISMSNALLVGKKQSSRREIEVNYFQNVPLNLVKTPKVAITNNIIRANPIRLVFFIIKRTIEKTSIILTSPASVIDCIRKSNTVFPEID